MTREAQKRLTSSSLAPLSSDRKSKSSISVISSKLEPNEEENITVIESGTDRGAHSLVKSR